MTYTVWVYDLRGHRTEVYRGRSIKAAGKAEEAALKLIHLFHLCACIRVVEGDMVERREIHRRDFTLGLRVKEKQDITLALDRKGSGNIPCSFENLLVHYGAVWVYKGTTYECSSSGVLIHSEGEFEALITAGVLKPVE